jgi:hypothetical protein
MIAGVFLIYLTTNSTNSDEFHEFFFRVIYDKPNDAKKALPKGFLWQRHAKTFLTQSAQSKDNRRDFLGNLNRG